MKKIILAAVAASVAATGFAGSYAVPAASQPASDQSAYIELNGGYALTNYVKSHGFTAADYNHDNGGFAGGIAAGYHFMPNLGVEAGFEMPFQKTAKTADKKNHVTQYSFYGAGRLNANLGQGVDLFVLAGLGYTHQSDKTTGTEVKSSGIGFVGGAGVDYTVANNFVIGAKYLHFAGRDDNSKADNPAFASPQYFLVSVGYKIGM
jgi:opacity protein-like surface antigen